MCARCEIEETLNRWGRASDTRDLELKASTLTEDHVYRVDMPNAEPVIVEGRDAVVAHFRNLWEKFPDTGLKHLFSNLTFEELTEDSARAVFYMTAIRQIDGNPSISSSATHVDELRRVDGQWLISNHYQHVELKPGGTVIPRLGGKQPTLTEV